jgi:NAD(P)H dehydrogenase (quinone)
MFLRFSPHSPTPASGRPSPSGRRGVFASSVVNGRVSYITRADIARAVAAILTSDGHSGSVYELTGASAVSQVEIVELLNTIHSRPVMFQAITHDDGAAAVYGGRPARATTGNG